MKNVKKGDKVLCIDDSYTKSDWNHLVLMEIYTVEEVMHDGAVVLKEINNRHIDTKILARGKNDRAAFYAWHFIRLEEANESKKEGVELIAMEVADSHKKVTYFAT